MAIPRTTTNPEETTQETIVGPAIAIRGRIDGEEDLRVEGRIEGSISLTETLYVEPSGVVIAEVEARDVVVSGVIIGDVTAVNSVTLNKGAKLIGNIRAPRLIIADGASFRGDVTMDGDAPPPIRERTRATSTVSRAAIGNRSIASAGPSRARATVSGAYETRRASTGATASTGTSTPRTSATATAAPTPARAATVREPARAVREPSEPAPRREPVRDLAPPARPPVAGRPEDDDVTLVIKHSALRKGEIPPDSGDDDGTGTRRAKKSARIPARGRHKAGRR